MDNRKLAGNRVVRRRLKATQIIDMPAPRSRPSQTTPNDYARRFVVALAGIILTGGFLLALPFSARDGSSTSFVDALFTAVSAVSVTGLVVVDTHDHWGPIGQIVILCLIQIGGLGFTVGASLLLLAVGRGQRLQTSLIAHDGSPTLPISEAVSISKRIAMFVLVTEAIGAALFTMIFLRDHSLPVALWFGIFHSVSAFCNAGFDLQGDYRSMALYRDSVWVNLLLMGLIQAGSLSYIVLHDAWKSRSWTKLQLGSKLVLLTNIVLIVAGAAVFWAAEFNASLSETPAWSKPMVALFQSVSARTAGFATIDLGTARDASLFMWIGLMLVGGASGSTAGGVKLATFAIIVVAIYSTIRGHQATHIAKRRIPAWLVFQAIAIIALFLLVHFSLTLMLALIESLSGGEFTFVSIMFETMSAMATVGLSTGITSQVSDPAKLLLCLAMFFGRLGPLTLAYALTSRHQPHRYRLPETSVHIG